MGGWGPMFGTKSRISPVFLTPSLKYIEGNAVTAFLGAYRNIFCNFQGMLHIIQHHFIELTLTAFDPHKKFCSSILKNESSKTVEILRSFLSYIYFRIIWPSDDKISEFRPSKFQEWSQGKT